MLKTVEGIYQNGQIELTELPQDVSDWLRHRPKGDRTQVLITFLDSVSATKVVPGKIDPTKVRHLNRSVGNDCRHSTRLREPRAQLNSPYRRFHPRNAAKV